MSEPPPPGRPGSFREAAPRDNDPGGLAVVVPALDEEEALPLVLADLGRLGLVSSTVVVDNGSRDGTFQVALAAGARAVSEPRRGYGAACLRGLAELRRAAVPPAVVVFLDADGSSDPLQIPSLAAPVREGKADLVLGSRTDGRCEPGAFPWHQRAGTIFYCGMIGVLFGHRFSDLGPFRAVAWEALESLRMGDTGFGWTAEMQVRALRARLRVVEVPVTFRRRIGRSKISGTVGGTLRAAAGLGWQILSLRFRRV